MAYERISPCGARGSAVSLEHWNVSSIPGPAQCVKVTAFLQLGQWLRLQLTFKPWPRNLHMPQVWPKEKRKEGKETKKRRNLDLGFSNDQSPY